MKCTCSDWKDNIDKINHGMCLVATHYGKGYSCKIFDYCPWCGCELEEVADRIEVLEGNKIVLPEIHSLRDKKLPNLVRDNVRPTLLCSKEDSPKYEMFCDVAYYDMWCVRSLNDKRFDSPMSFHFNTKAEAETFLKLIEVAK